MKVSSEIETICAIATAVGSGAVGIIRLSGPQSASILSQLSGRKKFRPRYLYHTWLYSPPSQEKLDEVLCCVMPAPRTYTGEEVAEIYAHGGAANLERLLKAVIAQGARLAQPGEFTRRAFLNGRMDLAQAESVAQIIGARSEQALANAQAILAGELGARLRELRGQMVELLAILEGYIDFVEELDESQDRSQLLDRAAAMSRALSDLADTYEQGRRLDGASVALVGPVNAGKSSLFNCLLGSSRAIVSAEAGTTRDYLEADVIWDGRRVTVVDTAGVRPDAQLSVLEAAGHELAGPIIRQCDLRVFVVDLLDEKSWYWLKTKEEDSQPRASNLLTTQETPERAAAITNPPIIVANKCDLSTARAGQEEKLRRFFPQAMIIATSAKSGEGLEKLRAAIRQALFGEQNKGEHVCLTQRRHWESIKRAITSIEEGAAALAAARPPELIAEHWRETLCALGEITGDEYTEAVLDAIFAKFCLGK